VWAGLYGYDAVLARDHRVLASVEDRPPLHSRKFLRATLFGAAIGAAGAVFAQQSDPRMSQIESRFKIADKNHDGRLTPDEAKLGMPKVAKHFDQLDKDKKGYVTLDEIKDAVESLR
jgi:hypothetical protein